MFISTWFVPQWKQRDSLLTKGPVGHDLKLIGYRINIKIHLLRHKDGKVTKTSVFCFGSETVSVQTPKS